MDRYITGDTIRRLREKRKMTQELLAEKLLVSSKAVSRWETGRGYPDISLLTPIADALGISVIELLSGNQVTNSNPASDMAKGNIYVCPICGNVIRSVGEALISCCGVTLPPLEAEEADGEHMIHVERVEDEYYVYADHSMSRQHYISFLCAVSDMGMQFAKLYPEGAAQTRFRMERVREILCYCNRHGLYRVKV